jgi:ACT domain-containing protein
MLTHVRISVPDRPGVLAQITAALADAGADIRTIAVLEREAGRAVDDVYLAWPDGRPLSALSDRLAGLRGLRLLGLRPSREVPGAFPDLDLLTHVLATSGRGVETLVDMATHAFSADWAAAISYGPSGPAVVYANTGPDDVVAVPDAPAIRPLALEQDGVQLVAAPLKPLDLVLVCGRAGPPPFHRAEVERVRRVTELAVGMLGPEVATSSASSG